MSSFQLKLLAVITMLIDHIGLLLFPQYSILRIIGRVSFPIFCFLISEGCIHTSNFKKYLLRLGLFAIISQIPFSLFLTGRLFNFSYLNVFFTLFFGALAIWIASKAKFYVSIPLIILIIFVVNYIKTDYSVFGVILILAFWLLRSNKWLQSGACAVGCIANWFLKPFANVSIYGAIAAIPILFYNGKKGKYSLKYFFYVFYPAHLLILYFINLFAF